MILNFLTEVINVQSRIGTVFGVMKGARLASQLSGSLNQGRFKSLLRKGTSGAESGETAADDQGFLNNRIRSFVKRFQEARAGHRHAHQLFGFVCRGLGFCLMNPGILFANVGQFKKIWIEPCVTQRVSEQRLMGSRCAGGHHHAIEAVLFDGGLNFLELIGGAGKHAIGGIGYIGQRVCILGDGRDVNHTGNIDAAMTDKDADARLFFADVTFFGDR